MYEIKYMVNQKAIDIIIWIPALFRRPVCIFYAFMKNYFSNPRMKHYQKIEKTIISTATRRGSGKSTCPSEIARMLFPEDWRKHMQDIRQVAIDLHNKGSVLITQKGDAIDVKKIIGPIRIKIR